MNINLKKTKKMEELTMVGSVVMLIIFCFMAWNVMKIKSGIEYRNFWDGLDGAWHKCPACKNSYKHNLKKCPYCGEIIKNGRLDLP